MLEPEYQKLLENLPKVAEREVRERAEGPDGTVKQVVYYRFAGSLSPAVQAAIGGSSISWDEVSVFDPRRHELRIEIKPHVLREKFTCRGAYVFVEEGAGTRRDLQLDLEVRVLFVGSAVEGAIGKGLQQTLDHEARILSDYLAGS